MGIFGSSYMDSFSDYGYSTHMGRPAKPDDEKRQQITLRFDPTAMRRFQSAADANGRSLGKEIEERASATADFDNVGLELIRRLGAGMVALQQRHGGILRHKPWHVDLSCWAAIAELFAEGPIFDMRPLSAPDEEAMWEACLPVFEVDLKREAVVAELAALGIEVALERKVRGLLKLDSRAQERASIDSIPDSEHKPQAVALHDALRALDVEHEAAVLACRDAMQPYWAAEDAGRQKAWDYLQEDAKRRRNAGERVNPFHIIGQFPVWR